MIIIGYQGIGKSTLTRRVKGYIDLESSCFWYNGLRPQDWYIYYCQIAEDLSRQGYDVFVSSHEPVRKFLRNSKEKVIVIYPSLSLKDKWIEKLRIRYDNDPSEKNHKALLNAEDRYEDNIKELMDSGFDYGEITEMDYDLDVFIHNLMYMMETKSRKPFTVRVGEE